MQTMHQAMITQNENCLKEIRKITGQKDEVTERVSTGSLYPKVDKSSDKGD
jgi:hypothetical protein